MTKTKTCSTCKKSLSVTEFSKDKRRSSGRRAQCKRCVSLYDKKYREKHSEHLLKRNAEYRTKNKLEMSVCQKKYYLANRDWYLRYHRSYGIKHREEIKARKTEYRASHRDLYLASCAKRRSAKLSSSKAFTGQEFKNLCKKYANRCLCCGRSDVPLTADHVIPLSLSGSNSIENIQPLCQSCNSRKAIKTIDYRTIC